MKWGGHRGLGLRLLFRYVYVYVYVIIVLELADYGDLSRMIKVCNPYPQAYGGWSILLLSVIVGNASFPTKSSSTGWAIVRTVRQGFHNATVYLFTIWVRSCKLPNLTGSDRIWPNLTGSDRIWPNLTEYWLETSPYKKAVLCLGLEVLVLTGYD